jgi:hypothetical protein
MEYKITTKQGNNYIVSDENVWLWIQLERELGYTITQADEKINQGSLDVLTFLFYNAAKNAGHTKMPNQQAWVLNEFDTFEGVKPNPKENSQTDLSE